MKKAPVNVTRRGFVQKLAILTSPAILGVMGGGVTYGVVERQRLVVEKKEIKLPLGPNGPAKLRLVSLTDLHYDPLYESAYVEQYVKMANSLQPDVVALTGDFITRTSTRIDDLSKILGNLSPSMGVYACLGNHDYWDNPATVSKSLSREGVQVLLNDHTRVVCPKGGELVLAGVQSVWGGNPNWANTSKGLGATDRVITLMHEPDFADKLSLDPRISLQLSGHTHGGQVCMPGYGALILPKWGKKYQAGLYGVGNMKLYVNRGLGTVTHHVRFWCPPEIACLDLVNTDLVS